MISEFVYFDLETHFLILSQILSHENQTVAFRLSVFELKVMNKNLLQILNFVWKSFLFIH